MEAIWAELGLNRIGTTQISCGCPPPDTPRLLILQQLAGSSGGGAAAQDLQLPVPAEDLVEYVASETLPIPVLAEGLAEHVEGGANHEVTRGGRG